MNICGIDRRKETKNTNKQTNTWHGHNKKQKQSRLSPTLVWRKVHRKVPRLMISFFDILPISQDNRSNIICTALVTFMYYCIVIINIFPMYIFFCHFFCHFLFLLSLTCLFNFLLDAFFMKNSKVMLHEHNIWNVFDRDLR